MADGLHDEDRRADSEVHQEPKFGNTCASEISYAFNCIDGHLIDTSGDYGKGGMLVKKVRTLTIGHTDVWVDGEIDNPSLYFADWYAKVKTTCVSSGI